MNFESPEVESLRGPGELSGPLPRKVRLNLSDGGTRISLFAVLLFFLAGSASLGWYCFDALTQMKQRDTLRTDGRDADGVVTGFSTGLWKPVVVEYKFKVDGLTYSGRAQEPKDSNNPGLMLNQSDSLVIRFLPSNPAINHPVVWEWTPSMMRNLVLTRVFMILIAVVASFGLFRDRKLVRLGTVAAGKVTNCTPKGGAFQIEYEFATPDGESLKGSNGRVDPCEVGSRVWVLYLRQNPKRNDMYPLTSFDIIE